MPCCTTEICERSAFQGAGNPACGSGQAFYVVGGFRKPLLFCTEASELHRSLKGWEPQRKEGRVKEINQKFLREHKRLLGTGFPPNILHIKQGGFFKIKAEKSFVLLQALRFLFG